MPAKGKRKHAREERLEVVRRMIVEQGLPRWRIYRVIVEEYGVSKRTVRRDFAELAKRYREQLDDAEVIETQVGGILEAFQRIARKAEADGDWHAAIRANVEAGRVLGLRLDRWVGLRSARHGAERLEVESAELTLEEGQIEKAKIRLARRAGELLELPTEELEAKRKEYRERFRVIEGGDADDGGG